MGKKDKEDKEKPKKADEKHDEPEKESTEKELKSDESSGSLTSGAVLNVPTKDKKKDEKTKKEEERHKKEEEKHKKEEEKKLAKQKKDEEKAAKKTMRKGTVTTKEPEKLPPMPEDNELSKMFSSLLDELEIPKSARDEMMKNYSNQMKWNFLYQHKVKMDNTKKALDSSATLKDSPQYFVSKLKAEVDINILTSLRVSLQSEPLIWLTSFRELYGISLLLQILQDTERKSQKTKDDLEIILQCILSLKSLMNNKYGMKEILETKDAINKIVLCLDCDYIRIRIAIFEIMSTICYIHGSYGHHISMEAIYYYKYVKREETRFSHLVNILRFNHKGEHYQVALIQELKIVCLSFINCLINIPDKIAERIEIRTEFLRIGLKEIVEELSDRDKSVEMQAQVRVFVEDLQGDEEEFAERFKNRKINVEDPVDMFKNLQDIVSSLTYLQKTFHSILKSLVGLPVDLNIGFKCWLFAERVLQQIAYQRENVAIGEEKFDIKKLLNSMEDKAALEILQKKHAEIENGYEFEKSAHAQTLKEKNEEIYDLKKKMEKKLAKQKVKIEEAYEARIKDLQLQIEQAKSDSGNKREVDALREQIAALTEENHRMKSNYSPNAGNSGSSQTTTVETSGGPPPPPPPMSGGMDDMSGPPPPPPPPGFDPDAGGPPPPPPPFGGGGPPPPPPMGGGPPPPPGGGPGALPKIKVPKPSVAMKNLNWTKIPNSKIQNTLFSQMGKLEVKVDFGEMEGLFCKKIIEKKKDAGKTEIRIEAKRVGPAKPTAVSIVDGRRSQNVGIFLSTMKLSNAEIKKAVITIDEKYINAEVATRLLDNCPKDEEVTAIKQYLQTGDPNLLGHVEKYFMEIQTVPALSSRLKNIVFKFNFPIKVSEVRPDIAKIKDASKELLKSKKFHKLVEVTLLLGNFMNGASPSSIALGFKLPTLLKLVDTKTLDNKSSLLHYLIKLCKDKYADDDIASFVQDLSNVRVAKSVSLSNIQSEMADLKKKLNEAETEFKNVPKVEEMEDLFLMKMPTELRRIKEEYESMENALADALKDYTKATELFGENPTVMQPEQLFGTVASFIDLWEKADKELKVAAEKAEKARKKAEDEERKRKADEEKKKKAESAKKNDEDRDEGIMDSALAKIKGGEAFTSKRKERREKRMEAEDALSSVMSTLTNLTTQSGREKEKKIAEETASTNAEDESLDEKKRRREERRKQQEDEAKKLEDEEEKKRQERRKRLEALRNS